MAAAAEDPIDVALRVAAAIEQVGGRYFVGGSLASSLHGEPRSTNDIDIVVELPLGRIGAFVQSLGPEFEVDLDMVRDALLRGGCCNIFHLPTVTKIDLFAVGGTPFDEAEFSRRSRTQVRDSGEALVLKSPEDTVLRKLLWYEAGGRVSDRQWRDVVQVLRVSGARMDRGYLAGWAGRLGLVELLQRALAEAAPLTGGAGVG